MATIITNQATLNYKFGSVSASTVSNVTSTVLGGSYEIEKSALNDSYHIGNSITYIITIKNNGSELTNLTVTDNLGEYDFGGTSLKPLDYVGPARLFINGDFNSLLTPIEGSDGIVLEIDSIPAGGIAQIIYLATPNSFAGPCCGDEIVNTATAECQCPCNTPISTSNTIFSECYADVRILKSVCPNPIVCGEDLTYVFDIENYGNIPATEVVLTDVFNPPLNGITVSLDGSILPEDAYSYEGGELTIPTECCGPEISVPAATCVQDPETGVISIIPGKIQIVVNGSI